MDAGEGVDDLGARLRRYAELVSSSPHNLMSPAALAELSSRHVPESVHVARALPGGGRYLDLGTGGGLPGMVVALVRDDLEAHLLDATRKKTDFLRATAAELGVDVRIHTGRAEELAHDELAGSFRSVTARAVAPLSRLLPWVTPFLAPDGRLYAIKGERWQEELAEAAPVLRDLDLEVIGTPATDPQLAPDPGRPEAPRVVIISRRRALSERPRPHP